MQQLQFNLKRHHIQSFEQLNTIIISCVTCVTYSSDSTHTHPSAAHFNLWVWTEYSFICSFIPSLNWTLAHLKLIKNMSSVMRGLCQGLFMALINGYKSKSINDRFYLVDVHTGQRSIFQIYWSPVNYLLLLLLINVTPGLVTVY